MERRGFLKGVIVFGCSIAFRNLGFGLEDKEKIYLTIDDGPKNTHKDILSKLGSEYKVTFFMIGELIKNPIGFKDACRALEFGHEIGNHSYSHPKFSRIDLNEVKIQIEKAHEIIDEVYRTVGRTNPFLFRFPYGDRGQSTTWPNETVEEDKPKKIREFLQEIGYLTYFWDIDPKDYLYYSHNKRSIEEIMADVRRAQTGDIVLIHDLPISTEFIIPFYIHSKRYTLKTLCNKV